MPTSDQSALTPAERRALLRPPVGSVFDPLQPMFGVYDSNTVFDYGEFDAADIQTMLRRDGKARSLEQVLTLPIRGATWKIDPETGDTGQAKLVQDSLGDKLGRVIDQMTTAVSFRRAYFETTWRLDGGNVVFDCIDWRPPTGCEAGFDPLTGKSKGFRQRIVPVGGVWPGGSDYSSTMPGYVIVKPQRAFIYTHGSYRDPVRGISDLDVAYWCWETKQKILFLWLRFLENQSLPKVVVYADDIDQAAELANDVASLKSSGVLGLPRPGEPGAKAFEVLESSGAGAGQFQQAVQYLESLQTASVLASFTDLPQAAAQGTGSYALSADQSEFFLASRQAVADEMAEAIREGLFTPLVRHNYGPDAPVPRLTIGPLSNRNTDRALAMLTSVIVAPQLNVPREFVDQLTQSVAGYLGLDPGKVEDAIAVEVKRREEADKLKAEQAKAMAQPQPPRPGQPPQPPKPAPGKPAALRPVANLARAVGVAHELVTRAEHGETPESVLVDLTH